MCPTLHAYKTIKVTNHKLVPVIMYDYYDNGNYKLCLFHKKYRKSLKIIFILLARRARMFYRAPKSFICDICEDANCGSLCEKAEKRESRRLGDGNTKDGSASVRQYFSSMLSALTLLMCASRLLI